jgi:hypothetical protein
MLSRYIFSEHARSDTTSGGMATPPLEIVFFILVFLLVVGVTYPFRRRVSTDAQIAIMFAVIGAIPMLWVAHRLVVEPPPLAFQRLCLLVVLLGMFFFTIAAVDAAHRGIFSGNSLRDEHDRVHHENGVSKRTFDSASASLAYRNDAQRRAASSDELQDLLQPLQQISEEMFYELDPVAHDPEAMAPWDLLAFRADGTPGWWLATRNDTPWKEGTPNERRRILLERIRENLPAEYPRRPEPRDIQRLLAALRHVAYGVTSGASDILSSDL